jgi:aspartyl-tRNA(Asn)/glutamyl-tRNA(Gln) amidotransferase subunit A
MYKLSAIELRNKFVNGEISAVEIASYYLNRIKYFDPSINAFLKVLDDRVLSSAEKLDEKRKNNKPLGKLAGIPIALKDNQHILGEITTCGSKFLSNYKALFNATAVELMEKEDGLLIGKTNLDEFAMGSSNENSAFFTTKNPWNTSCVPGGSSGGSAAAVAARICPIATGSDTGGSIRQPAAMCGVVGYKPTYGRVSRYGLVAFGSSLDQIGPFATTVQDVGLVMEAIGHPCQYDSTCLTLPPETINYHLPSSFKGIKIGVPWHFLEGIEGEAIDNFKTSISKLKDLGAEIIDINLDILKHSIAVYYILATAEASTNLARFDGIKYGVRSSHAETLNEIYDLSRDEGFGSEVKKRIMLGTYVLSSGYQDAYYKKAQKIRTLIIDAFEKAYDTCNFVAMPVATIPAFEINSIQDPIQMYLQDLFTICANLAGLPAISIPSGLSNDNKPFGLQLLGPQMHDVSVIRYANVFEQSQSYYKNIPPLFDKEHQ